jgi:hypothetical protein
MLLGSVERRKQTDLEQARVFLKQQILLLQFLLEENGSE